MKVIERELKNWIAANFGDGPYVVVGDDIMYNCVDDFIMISSKEPDHIESYIKYADSLGLDYTLELPWYVICFLHELGHAETIFDVPEHLIKVDNLLKIWAESESNTEFGLRLKSSVYYRLPVEKAATKWMIDFVSANHMSVASLSAIMTRWIERENRKAR